MSLRVISVAIAMDSEVELFSSEDQTLLLTNLSAWFSGVWFDLNLVGGTFRKIAYLLPFVHGAELEKALFLGNFDAAASHLLPVVLYSMGTITIAVFLFLRQMKNQ